MGQRPLEVAVCGYVCEELGGDQCQTGTVNSESHYENIWKQMRSQQGTHTVSPQENQTSQVISIFGIILGLHTSSIFNNLRYTFHPRFPSPTTFHLRTSGRTSHPPSPSGSLVLSSQTWTGEPEVSGDASHRGLINVGYPGTFQDGKIIYHRWY